MVVFFSFHKNKVRRLENVLSDIDSYVMNSSSTEQQTKTMKSKQRIEKNPQKPK